MNKLFLASLGVLFLLSCRKEATTWYSNWTIPVANDTLSLKNLVNDSTLSIQNGIYHLDLNRKIANISPKELIKIPDTTIRQGFAIPINSLTVQPGTSFINNNEDHVFALGDVELKKIRVKKGTIEIELKNPVSTKAFYEIELPSVSLNNVVLKRTLVAEAGTGQNPSLTQISIDLTNYYIDLTGSTGNTYNSLPSKITVNTDPNGDLATLNSQDSTIFTIKMLGIEVDYARGYFGKQKLSDNYTFESLKLANQVSGGIDLPNVDFQFFVKNGIKASATANLKSLSNFNSETNSTINLQHVSLDNPFTIATATNSWDNLVPSQKTIEFNGANSNLENFIENLGETTNLDFEFELNPWGNISGGWDEFFPNSLLEIYLKAQMPLEISANQLKLTQEYAFDFTQDKEKTNVNSASLLFKVENSFPFEGELYIDLLDSTNTVIQQIKSSHLLQSSFSGTLNSSNVLSTKSEFSLDFPAELISRISDIKKVKISVKLNTPTPAANQSTAIPENAFLKLKIQSSFKLENMVGK